MPAKRTHTVLMTVHFDKECTKSDAVNHVRDCINGTFYPDPTVRGNGPEVMTIRGIEPAPVVTNRKS